MTLLIKNIEVLVTDTDSDNKLQAAVAKKLGISNSDIQWLEIKKKSLDARKRNTAKFIYQVYASFIDEQQILKNNQVHASVATTTQTVDPLADIDTINTPFEMPPIIIGSGPAGIFCALILAYAGQPSIIIERGEPVESRQKTSNRLRRNGEFTEDSNYCFGEGGAGTFSDGKLSCGRNHPMIEFLFQEWVKFGAPKEILYDANPHIGTDNLTIVSQNMRKFLEQQGCQFLFNTKFVDFEKKQNIYSAKFADGSVRTTRQLILAIGHSARDTYRMLHQKKVDMRPKPFAVGARFEHPQELINDIQLGQAACHLPSAEYKLTAQVEDRGIWTFCMCPGGHLMPTNAQAGHLAVNGMSYYQRNSGFANAAVVVNVRTEDYFQGNVLDGIDFQEKIERQAFLAGGESYYSPAQRLGDFIAGKKSSGKFNSTYKPGLTSARLDQIIPPFITKPLQSALLNYDKKMRGYVSKEGLVVGVETKTSAPVMFDRDKATFQSGNYPGLYPIGEGAGFAGGIVSAALDGVRAGKAILAKQA